MVQHGGHGQTHGNARPVSATSSPAGPGVSRIAATSSVAAASPNATHVQRLAPSTMFSRPFQADSADQHQQKDQ